MRALLYVALGLMTVGCFSYQYEGKVFKEKPKHEAAAKSEAGHGEAKEGHGEEHAEATHEEEGLPTTAVVTPEPTIGKTSVAFPNMVQPTGKQPEKETTVHAGEPGELATPASEPAEGHEGHQH